MKIKSTINKNKSTNLQTTASKPKQTPRLGGSVAPKKVSFASSKSQRPGSNGYSFMEQGYFPRQRYSVASRESDQETIVTVLGEDYIDPLELENRTVGSIITDIKRGQVVYDLNFSPTMMNSPVMKKYASMYQQFRFKRVWIEYKPEVSVTTQGAILAVTIHDPTDKPPAAYGTNNIEYATSKQAVFSQLFNPFDVKWNPRDREKWYYCASTQADVAEEVQGKFYIFALGPPVLETDTVHHNVVFGSLFVRYEIEFKDLLLREKVDDSTIDIYYDGGSIAPGASVEFYTSTNTAIEKLEIEEGEIDEFLIENIADSALVDSGMGVGNIVYADAEYAYSADPTKAVLASIGIQIFYSLADVFLGQMIKNLGATLNGDDTRPEMTVKRMKLNPVRVNATVDQLVLEGKLIVPKYHKYVKESLDRLEKTHPDACIRYRRMMLSRDGIDSTPNWLRDASDPITSKERNSPVGVYFKGN